MVKMPKVGTAARAMINAIKKSGKKGLPKREIAQVGFNVGGHGKYDPIENRGWYSSYFSIQGRDNPDKTCAYGQGDNYGIIARTCHKIKNGNWVYGK